MNGLRDVLIRLPRWQKRGLMGVSDVVGLVIALGGAIYLQALTLEDVTTPWWQLPAVALVALICGAGFRLYSAVVRYMALRTAFRIASTCVATALLLLVLHLFKRAPLLEPRALINFTLLLFSALGCGRLLARHYLGRASDRDAERMLIYGAGEAGVQTAQSLANDRRRRVVGFVDDRSDLLKTEVAGLPVYRSSDLKRLLAARQISAVLLAIPSAPRSRKLAIVRELEQFPVSVKTIPSLQDILSGKAQIAEIRDVEIEDLLGREPVPPNEALLSGSITGRVVMVTGAGGSIGSELCKQIVQLAPSHLILFEISEYGLYSIEREVRALTPNPRHIAITAVLGDVLDRTLVDQCLAQFDVQVIFHAAAYKHVPLVEDNACVGMHNNVLGTHTVAEAALESCVERFVLVSTDKAVRPTNVMGATKRVAELVVQAMAQRAAALTNGHVHCVFSMVRFGNVLGSSGSVVPHFRRQIQAGGPLTVTHPEMIRYFMTIPEAAQLVIQAGYLAQGGEVFLLDMGTPVKIVDLARRMVRLAGLSVCSEDEPNGDIRIAFTGLRPGEKLYEELLIGENSIGTSHPKIGCAQEATMAWAELEPVLQDMCEASGRYDNDRAKALLRRVVREYGTPASSRALVAGPGRMPATIAARCGHIQALPGPLYKHRLG